MKTWEVMRLLEENPNRVYEARLARNPWVVRVRVETGCYKFTGHDANDGDQIIQSLIEERMALDLDWHEVRQPVPWYEAFTAWTRGSKVRIKLNGYEYPFQGFGELAIARHAINEGAWYVEERE